MIEPYENSLMTLSFTIKLSNPAIKKITVVTIVNIRMTFAFLGFSKFFFRISAMFCWGLAMLQN